ncbi:MAG: phosphotransferase family protein, partial [Anaerolineae bacterium]
TLADLHARIHSKKVSGLPVLRTRLENRINAAADLSEALRQRALAMLAYLPNEDTLCHGDFHPDSVLVGAEGPVIIDWADAARGHALADVATTLIRFGEIARETGTDAHSLGDLRTAYLERYRALTGASQQAIHTWLMPVAAARLGDPAVVARDYLLGVVSGNPV